MRRLFLCAGLLCAASVSASAERPLPPFAPQADVTDHVVTMIERRGQDTITYTIVRHGKWARVETSDRSSHWTSYFAPDGPIEIDVSRGKSDDVVSVAFRRGSEPDGWPYEPRNTGERQTLLGETCTVWNVRRSPHSDTAELSCVTDDGIELWHKLTGQYGDSAFREVTRVERRPLAPSDVQPPREFLSLAWWEALDSGSAAPPPAPDYETIMPVTRSIQSQGIIRTTRQRRPWLYVDETADGARRRFTLSNAATGLLLDFSRAAAGFGEQSLTFRRKAYTTLLPIPPSPTNQHDEVLGESCEWFTDAPTFGAAVRACRTEDGITLKENIRSGFFWDGMFTATHLARRTVNDSEVTPPAEILDPKYWGLD
jgi:hypothetical protein